MAIELTPLFVGGMPGGMELAVILLIAVLLFGANKIPKLARSTGEAMGEFKKGREEVEQELREMQEPSSSANADAAPGPDIEAEPADTESEPVTETEAADDEK